MNARASPGDDAQKEGGDPVLVQPANPMNCPPGFLSRDSVIGILSHNKTNIPMPSMVG